MGTNMEKVGPGKFVEYSYRLYNDKEDALLFETPADAPDQMVFGVSHDVVPGLIKAMEDLSAGDRFAVTLPPEAAFGPRFEENVVSLEKDIFMRDGKLVEEVKVGAELPMQTAEGMIIRGRVLEIDDKHVKMDFNHPFAGLTVRYEGEIKNVREATPEELQPAQGHGCGGCCGGGGSCGGHDCGDGCGDGCGGCH